MKRTLGRSGIEVSALGMGCWAIGGTLWEGTDAIGWGEPDDRESIRALQCGFEKGINLIDTADLYGAGHSERVVAEAIRGRRDRVVITTKFGNTFEEATRQATGENASPDYIKRACEASLRRLACDYIDLYLFHLNDYPAEAAEQVMDTLETLVAEGKIRYYGWSTNHPDRAEQFASGKHCTAIEHEENLLNDHAEMIALCERHHLASINRAPLGMGLITGKYNRGAVTNSKDLRGAHSPAWISYFSKGAPSAQYLEKVDTVREILTADGRTPAQGALAWLWGRSGVTIPIPGFRNTLQVTQNAAAMDFGPLTPEQMKAIAEILQ